MPEAMNTSQVERAFARLGELLEYPSDIELFLVGGAAGMLTGLLSPNRTTIDCDVMEYAPAGAMIAVETAAEKVAKELGLPPNWLNSDVQMRIDTLPDRWKTRRLAVGAYGALHVFAAGRYDLIAMKVIAGRAQDLEDLEAMRIRADDIDFVRAHLATLKDKGTHQSQIDDAYTILESLKVHEGE